MVWGLICLLPQTIIRSNLSQEIESQSEIRNRSGRRSGPVISKEWTFGLRFHVEVKTEFTNFTWKAAFWGNVQSTMIELWFTISAQPVLID